MAVKEKRTEILVGLFLFIGLLICGILIVQFGRFQDRFQNKYEITLNFPDATGIQKGSDVKLGGAKVGVVSEKPVLNKTFSRTGSKAVSQEEHPAEIHCRRAIIGLGRAPKLITGAEHWLSPKADSWLWAQTVKGWFLVRHKNRMIFCSNLAPPKPKST